MNAPLQGRPMAIPRDTLARQQRAHDPAASVWVAANAGAGKTHVLSRRVMRLLLAGSPPSRILCLTYTKAAASEMAGRIFVELSRWATADDDALRAVLVDLEGVAPTKAQLAEARRLFARALETPGGLKVETIHAFCERILHLFPLEANVPGYFEVIDEGGAAELLEAVMLDVLAEASQATDTMLGRAFDALTGHYDDASLQKAIRFTVGRSPQIEAWIADSDRTSNRPELDHALGDLGDRLGLDRGCDRQMLFERFLEECPIDKATLEDWHHRLNACSKATDREASKAIEDILTARASDTALTAWQTFLLTKAGTARKSGSRFTKDFHGDDEALLGLFDAAAEIGLRLEEGLRALRTVEMTGALLRIATEVGSRCRDYKTARGLLDFDDLIRKTAQLLTDGEAADWVLYKLDYGLDHILVDEAQDTSPVQWQIIARLIESFFAGEGSRDGRRTVFAVGDEKQSIYSFQGAVPGSFSFVGDRLRRRVEAAAATWRDVALGLSFRSAPKILEAVDRVFVDGPSRDLVTGETRPHEALPGKEGGVVEVWPAFSRENGKDDEGAWWEPLDAPQPAEVDLANAIAAEVEDLVAGTGRNASGAPVDPGRIMILTRSRGRFVAAMNRALKQRGLPVAGADRLALRDHIAVRDLLALAEVVLMPEDDLNLAALLRSPLVGLDEDALYELAHGRRGTLWRALRSSPREDARRAHEQLAGWQGMADRVSPFAFFARVLGRDGGRLALLERLGSEAEDVIDAFMAVAQAYEKSAVPSLHGFVAHVRSMPGELKRESEARRAEIRVMTVHGAKGLEADTVFLVDTGAPILPDQHRDALVACAGSDPARPPAYLWYASKTAGRTRLQSQLEEELLDAARREYLRLLYVGMTRARERLYVCGLEKDKTPQSCWLALVRGALEADAETIDRGDGRAPRLRWPRGAHVVLESPDEQTSQAERQQLPDWLRRPAVPVEKAPDPLRPSGAPVEEEPSAQPLGDALEAAFAGQTALQRGLLIHRLLQSLPSIALGERRQRAIDYLTRRHPGDPDVHAALVEEALRLIEDPAHAELFSGRSRAEVPLAGELKLGDRRYAISGRIDRLVVGDERVLIVDYKTDMRPPADWQETAPAYLRQLALYRALLMQIYPDRPCEAALLWTAVPRLMPLPAEPLNKQLRELAREAEGVA